MPRDEYLCGIRFHARRLAIESDRVSVRIQAVLALENVVQSWCEEGLMQACCEGLAAGHLFRAKELEASCK